jgi:O-antigen/teichoic acid export membrane protein
LRLAPQFTKPMSLRRNFSWTFVGNFIYAASQWGMLTVLAKIGTPEMVGQFALGLAVTAPVIMFSNMQLRAVQATDAKEDYLFSDYLTLRLVTTILALVVIAAIILFSGYKGDTALVIVGVSVAKSFESISDVFYGLFQQRERMDHIAHSLMIRGPLSLVVLGLGVYLTGKFIWGVVGMTVAWGLILFCFDMPNGVKILKMGRFNPLTIEAGSRSFVSFWPKCEKRLHVLKRLLWLALPLGLVMFLNSLNTNIPRYFIEHHLGSKQLGIFSAMAYLLVAGNTVVNSLGQSSSPRLAKYYAAGDSGAFRSLLYKLIGIGIIIGAFGIFIAVVVGKEVLTLLYTPEFAVCGDVFVWLMIAAAVLYVASILNYGMMATRSFTSQLPLFALITVGSVAACAWLIPKYGLLGAALATLSAGLIQFAGSAWINGIALLKIQKG